MSLFDEDDSAVEQVARLKQIAQEAGREQAATAVAALRKSQGKRLPSIQTSVSQVEKAEACPRKWGFEKLFRMREPGMRYGMVFGNVLHAVLERWLKADDQGRDPLTGKEADVYPPGWQWDMQNRTRIQPDHDQRIRDLVDQSIEKGILVRAPDRKVEEEFWGLVFEPPAGPWSPFVTINGKVDLETHDTIGDHKSVKRLEYAKTTKELFENLQGGVYAYRKFQLQPDLDVIQFEHYLYGWTENKVHVKRAKDPVTGEEGITRAQAEKTWERYKRVARDMQTLKNVRDPFQLPAAREGAGAGRDECNQYGGCGFMSVCTRGTVDEFVKIRSKLATLGLPEEENLMALKKPAAPAAAPSKLKSDLAAKAAAVSTGKPKAKAAPADDDEEVTVIEEDDDTPPAKPAKKKAAPVVEEEVEEETAEEVEEETPPPAKPKAKAKPKAAPVEEEEEQEEVVEETAEEETPAEDEDEALARVNGSLLTMNKAQLLTLSKEELASRLLAIIAFAKGISQ